MLTVDRGTSSKLFAEEGEQVTVTANEVAGKKFVRWETTNFELTEEQQSSSTTTFTMPAESVVIKAIYEDIQGPQEELTYRINVSSCTASQASAKAGEIITITATIPDEISAFNKWSVKGITLTEEQMGTNPLTFIMPANDVNVSATFVTRTSSSTATPKPTSTATPKPTQKPGTESTVPTTNLDTLGSAVPSEGSISAWNTEISYAVGDYVVWNNNIWKKVKNSNEDAKSGPSITTGWQIVNTTKIQYKAKFLVSSAPLQTKKTTNVLVQEFRFE